MMRQASSWIVNDSPNRLRPLALVHCTVRHSWRQLRAGAGPRMMVPVATGAIPLRSGQRIKRQSAQLIDRSIEPGQRRDQTRILAQTPLKRQ